MLRRHLTYANVMATVAVFLGLGGASFAATHLGRNSVGSRQIRNGAIKSKDIKDGALKRVDFRSGVLAGGGSNGSNGATGQQGPQGPQGPAGATNVVMRQGPSVTVTHGSFGKAEAACQSGERATGGGVYNESNVLFVQVTSSYPTPNPTSPPATGDGKVPTGWRVWVRNDSPTTDYAVNAYVICAAP